MKKQNKLILSAALAGGMAVMSAGTARGTILSFLDFPTNSTPIPQDYGDNVAAANTGGYTYSEGGEGYTPNVGLTWNNARSYNSGYGDINPIVFGRNNEGAETGIFVMTLTADAGYTVTLHDMNAANYLNDTNAKMDWLKVTDENNNELFSMGQTSFDATGTTHNVIDFGDISGKTLTLKANVINGNTDIGFSQIRFSQSEVPEPASLGMMGLAGLAMLRRRRQA